MDSHFMKCGCAANAERAGKPICSLHSCDEELPFPDLAGRQARCSYGCGAVRASSIDLAFFQHCPEQEHDKFYCGCFGWE